MAETPRPDPNLTRLLPPEATAPGERATTAAGAREPAAQGRVAPPTHVLPPAGPPHASPPTGSPAPPRAPSLRRARSLPAHLPIDGCRILPTRASPPTSSPARPRLRRLPRAIRASLRRHAPPSPPRAATPSPSAVRRHSEPHRPAPVTPALHSILPTGPAAGRIQPRPRASSSSSPRHATATPIRVY
nr:translation initiation factor IF-2-like [Aegilops tauschii subsp. strangulata]